MDKSLLKEEARFDEKNGILFFGSIPAGAEEIKRKHDPLDKRRWSKWRHANFSYLKKIFENAQFNREHVVADLGAGPQHFQEITHLSKVIAVDLIPLQGINIVCDITKPLPFRDGVFDMTLATNTLEHMEDPQRFLAEAFRITKTGGLFVGTIPFLMSSHQRPFDFQRYTDIGLQKILENAGFCNVIITRIGTPNQLMEGIAHDYEMIFHRSAATQKNSRVFFYNKAVRLGLLLHRMSLKILLTLGEKLPSSASFTEGYGFVAKKI